MRTDSFEVWEMWSTHAGSTVFLITAWPRPPRVRGAPEDQEAVRAVVDALGPYDDDWTVPRVDADFAVGLEARGWSRVGHSRRENLAAAHLTAAVRRGEASAIHELRMNERRREMETPDQEPRDAFTHFVLASTEADRARENSRSAVILAVAALEAFINEAALGLPAWGEREDRISLGSKWVLVPALRASGATFDRGSEPFQSFASLIALRNRFVHPRPRDENFEGPASLLEAATRPVPGDADLAAGRSACLTARRMILEYCRLVGAPPPEWCAYAPPAAPDDLDAWSKANILTGVREDPDFPPIGSLKPPGYVGSAEQG